MIEVKFNKIGTTVYFLEGNKLVECEVLDVKITVNNDEVDVRYNVINPTTWKPSNEIFDSKEALKEEVLKQFV